MGSAAGCMLQLSPPCWYRCEAGAQTARKTDGVAAATVHGSSIPPRPDPGPQPLLPATAPFKPGRGLRYTVLRPPALSTHCCSSSRRVHGLTGNGGVPLHPPGSAMSATKSANSGRSQALKVGSQ